MNPREINTTFEITTASMNQHIALAKSNVRANRPALLYVHFEIEGDRVHVVTTDGRMQLHTETMATSGVTEKPLAFDVRAMPRISAKEATTNDDGSSALFAVQDGLIISGDIVARITVDVGYPNWRNIIPGHAYLERETAWRILDPKYYAIAQKFAGRNAIRRPWCVPGLTDGPVVFREELEEGEINTAVVMPFREG